MRPFSSIIHFTRALIFMKVVEVSLEAWNSGRLTLSLILVSKELFYGIFSEPTSKYNPHG